MAPYGYSLFASFANVAREAKGRTQLVEREDGRAVWIGGKPDLAQVRGWRAYRQCPNAFLRNGAAGIDPCGTRPRVKSYAPGRRSNRTLRLAAGLIFAGSAVAAHAQTSFFQLEAGIGAAHSSDQGDDIWIQKGLGSHEQLNSFAWMAGFTGEPINHLAWHVDFVDLGRVSAQTPAVADDDYSIARHQVIHDSLMPATTTPFSGSGRTMGIALTLEPNYTWRGIRFGVEGGPFVYRATWDETIWNNNGTISQVNHAPQVQVGYVVGASVGYKNFAIAYRYYADKTKWHPVPGLVSKTSTLMLTYRF